MPYGSIDFPAHDSNRTVGSKCHVWHSKLRQSRKYASISDLFSFVLIVLLFNAVCNLAVASFFDWLFDVSAAFDIDGDELVDELDSGFFKSLSDVGELTDCVGFGDDARTVCELNYK